jgi:hypothetical protein
MKKNSESELPQSLTDRVAERVVSARLALEDGPKSRRSSSPVEATATAELREVQSLKRVFRDMGVSYRRYRRETGKPVVPGLRDAAYGFRENPSLSSLVAVAAYLDELEILT